MYWTDLFAEAGETPIYSYTATAYVGVERATADKITRFRDAERGAACMLAVGLKSMCQSMDLVECYMFEGLERATHYQRRGCAVRLLRVPDRATKPCSVLELVVPCRLYPWSRCQSRQDVRSADTTCSTCRQHGNFAPIHYVHIFTDSDGKPPSRRQLSLVLEDRTKYASGDPEHDETCAEIDGMSRKGTLMQLKSGEIFTTSSVAVWAG
jgi:hypothetical protein